MIRVPAYIKPPRFSTLLRDIRKSGVPTPLSANMKYALRAVVNARAGSTLSYGPQSDVEVARVDLELDRLGCPSGRKTP